MADVSPPSIAVYLAHDHPASQVQAERLAERLGIPLTLTADAQYDLLLTVTPRRLELRDNSHGGCGPVYVDFVGGALGYNRRVGRLEQRRLLFSAIGLGGHTRTVLDATAGLGRDAFLLACKGCRVTAVERSGVLAAMLEDGIHRAADIPELADVIRNRFRLVHGDARALVSSGCLDPWPEVVYLDPMFPPKKKSALVKKEMRILRRLVGDDADAASTFAAVRARGVGRIVVKRLRHAPPLAADPTRTLKGKSTRYDVYEP